VCVVCVCVVWCVCVVCVCVCVCVCVPVAAITHNQTKTVPPTTGSSSSEQNTAYQNTLCSSFNNSKDKKNEKDLSHY
jgi:hypothetical protein